MSVFNQSDFSNILNLLTIVSLIFILPLQRIFCIKKQINLYSIILNFKNKNEIR